MNEVIRAVDLFCGSGGMSLGFELYKGSLRYQVVMALDNDRQRVKCYNINFPKKDTKIPNARRCDLTWFSHTSEVLLYYLAHYALWKPDPNLHESLKSSRINLYGFLSQLRQIDQDFEKRWNEMRRLSVFSENLKLVDSKIFSIAICKAFFNRLCLALPKNISGAINSVPWKEEYLLFPISEDSKRREIEPLDIITSSLNHQWDSEISKLKDASVKQGKGQHGPIAARLQTLINFLTGDAGKLLNTLWLEWRSRRDSLRASFCLQIEEQLHNLYTEDRRVHLLLGGPPCKGFSRIGRAVAASLREQGAHSWTSHEYGDERNALLHKYVLFLEALRPNVFIFENVAHFKSTLKTPSGLLDAASVLQESIEELSSSKLHFNVTAQIVKAREYAIPQERERFIMAGFSQGKSSLNNASSFFNLRKYETKVPLQLALLGLDPPCEFSFTDSSQIKVATKVKSYTLIDPAMPDSFSQFLKWIRQPQPGKRNSPLYIDSHIVRQSRPDDFALIEKFAPGQRWMDYKLTHARTLTDMRQVLEKVLSYQSANEKEELPPVKLLIDLLNKVNGGLLLRLILEELKLPDNFEDDHHLLLNGYLNKGTDNHGDWFERLSANHPCKTIVAHIGKDTYGYIHPYENRALSIREAGRIQSFPDFYSFGSVGIVDAYAMIGDAVPPLLAYTFAEQLANLHMQSSVFSSGIYKHRQQENPLLIKQMNLALS